MAQHKKNADTSVTFQSLSSLAKKNVVPILNEPTTYSLRAVSKMNK